MRAENTMPQPPRPVSTGGSRRMRIFGIAVVAVLFFLVISMRGIARFYTDYLWFDHLDLVGVWRGVLLAKMVLAIIFIVAFFVLLWGNLFIADRLAPVFRPPGPEEQILARYHDAVGGRSGVVRFALSAFFAFSVGAGASTQWNNWILYRNGGEFGTTDAQFGRDIGFYIFELPFLTFVVDWVFTALLITLIITAGAHYMNGGIRLQTVGEEERVTPQVKAHLSVLLGLMAIVKAVDYWLARFELTVSRAGFVDGATYTDVNARLPVFNLLILIAIFAFVLFLVNIRLRGWVLPTVAVGLWFIVSVIMQGIYPFIVQRIVEGSEVEREEAFIARNIDATRAAYGLDTIDVRDFEYSENLGADDILANRDNLLAMPLLDRAIVDDVFRLKQAELEFYKFPTELDLDRYEVDGEVVPVVVGARSLSVADLSSPSWVSEHISFTHGNGVAIAPVAALENQPQYLIGSVPVENNAPLDIPLDEPRIYHGEDMAGYAIINATVDEIDFLDENDAKVANRYDGEAGVRMGGFFRQSAFALRFWSIDPLISDLATSESRVIYTRDIEDRLEAVAPFLQFDADPYAVVADGRIQYIVDGYTTSGRYPYSQRANRELLLTSSGLAGDHNYVRNSVKAVVDSFDGTVTLYISDPDDPIVNAYAKAFPELFRPASDLTDDLAAHIRYPEDLFTVQTNMLSRYQISSPSQFYDEFGGWDVAQDPGSVKTLGSSDVTAADGISRRTREDRVDPYYMYLRLPGETDADFVLMRSYVEVSDNDQLKEMTAFIAAPGDWGEPDYGRLALYRVQNVSEAEGLSESAGVAGPALAASNMSSQEEISEKISLLDVEGTEVELDDLVIIPVEGSLLYVRPFYVTPTITKLPALEWVIMAYGDRAVMCPTYDETLVALFGVGIVEDSGVSASGARCVGDVGDLPPAVSRPSTSGPAATFSGDNAALLTNVAELLADADTARQSGDLGEYQRLVSEAIALLESGGDSQATDATDADPGDGDGAADGESDDGEPA